MHELQQQLRDAWRDRVTRAIERYVQAEQAALREVATSLEAWLLDIQPRLPAADWRVEWRVLVERWQAQGIELVEPNEGQLATLFAARSAA